MVKVLETGVERWCNQLSYKRADSSVVPVYQAFPKQDFFHNSKARYRLFGGAAGPGKTLSLLAEAVISCHEAGEDGIGVETLLLRRTVPQLETSLLREFRKNVPREMYRDWHEQKKICTWHNGSKTRFGSMQYEADVWGYQGGEFYFVGWDELTQFLLSQWETMKTWNRCPREMPREAGMAGATNPIGVGAVWVRSLFVKRESAPAMERPERYDPEEYDFIPALVADNPIYAEDQAYLASLDSLPPVLRAAMLEGRWDIAIGAYFDIFDTATMVVRAEEIGMKSWWPRWVSGDWGYKHPAAFHWHTISPEGVVYTYREYVESKKSPHELADEVADRSVYLEDGKQKPEPIRDFFFSPDAFARRTDALPIAQQMASRLQVRGLPTPAMASDDRIGGWMLMYQMLKEGTWKIADSCRKLVDILPLLPRDEKHVEDVMKIDGDDPADSARYGLYSKLRERIAPLEERVAAKVTAVDRTARNIQAMRAFHEERKKGKPLLPGSKYSRVLVRRQRNLP